MAPNAFAETSSLGGGASLLLTPLEPKHAWLAIGRPQVLEAEVYLVADSKTAANESSSADTLVSLLPLIFKKLLGQNSLEAVPWAMPVIRARKHQDRLLVHVALACSPSATEGLFEVSTPLGRVEIRLLRSHDTRESEAPELPAEAAEDAPVLTLTLPNDWLDTTILRAAWGQQVLEFDATNAEHAPLACWHGWLSQWGEVKQLLLSTHAAGEEEDLSLLAVRFANVDTTQRCYTALGGNRLLYQKEPSPKAVFSEMQLKPSAQFDQQVEAAWLEHVKLEQEVSRIDRALVLQEIWDAVPVGVEGCLAPLLQILERWLESGALHATSTVCAQRRLQEAEPSGRHKSPELFRRACWHGAFRVVMQIRPSQDEPVTLALAICEHWRKAHGVCFDIEEEQVRMLSGVLQEVWLLSGRAQEELRQAAESDALNAEKALMEELEAESEKAKGKKRKPKKDKQKRRERAASGSGCSSKEATDAGDDAASEKAEVQGHLGQVSRSEGEKSGAPDRKGIELAKKPPRPNQKRQQGRTNANAAAPQKDVDAAPVRRPADIESILEAVRKSEELHRQPSAPSPEALDSSRSSHTDRNPPASSDATSSLTEASSLVEGGEREDDGDEPEVYVPPQGKGGQEDSSTSALSASIMDPSTSASEEGHSEETFEIASSHESSAPEVVRPRTAVPSTEDRSVVTWSDLGDLTLIEQGPKQREQCFRQQQHPQEHICLQQQQEHFQLQQPASLPQQMPYPQCLQTPQMLPANNFLLPPPPPVQAPILATCSLAESATPPPPTKPASPCGLLLSTAPPTSEASPAPKALELPAAALQGGVPALDDHAVASPAEEWETDPSPTSSSPRKGRRRRRRKGEAAVDDDDVTVSPGVGDTKTSGACIPSASGARPTTPATNRSVVTLSDLGLDLGAPSPPTMPAVSTPLAAASSCRGAAEHSPAARITWPAWQSYSPCGSPIAGTYPPANSPAAGCLDHGETLRCWLEASGLSSSGADLAEKLRALAPEAYED
eukprot:TRINITY_DN91202_c0_g1_i1.p1 TRINITY_DN91202_c0_g1~~TRINITY_DN91202_c0_g1_i1.p1  ORF type:complete len:1010 (-),score=220.54 TRINITY_DN91202_c0_g1_i1:54-3083(-)